MRDIFGRSSFAGSNPWAPEKRASVGCADCKMERERFRAMGSEIPDSDLACSKCKKKKMFSELVEGDEREDDIQMAGLGQVPPVRRTSSWVLAAGLLGVISLGILAVNS